MSRSVGAHLEVCPPCRDWSKQVDRLTARLRVEAVDTPDVLPAALAAWDEATARQPDAARPLRVLLTVAGIGSLALAFAHVLDIAAVTSTDAHSSRELAAVEAALACGFLLAAWRPHRFATGLAPLVALLSGLLVMVALVDVVAENTTLLGELVHLPAIGGAVLLLLLRQRVDRAGPQRAPVRRTPAEALSRS